MLGADRFGQAGEAVAAQQLGQAGLDPRDQPGSLVDQRRVQLHQRRAGADLGVGVGGARHPADADQRHPSFGQAVDRAKHGGGTREQGPAAQAAVAGPKDQIEKRAHVPRGAAPRSAPTLPAQILKDG